MAMLAIHFGLKPIQSGPFGALLQKLKPALFKTYHTYPTMMTLSTFILYLYMIQKMYKSHDIPFEFC